MDITFLAVESTSETNTKAVAGKIAQLLHGNETIELISDLGGGKTTFIQGLVEALGYHKPVTSPTFTLMNSYSIGASKMVHHYDLYRLASGGVLGGELAEDIHDEEMITLIEWANVISGVLPDDRLVINITVTGESCRLLTLSAGGPVSQRLITELKI